ncbi:MAG: FecR domain-containing protein [Phycisphaerales bacterium JB039]
MTHERDYLWTGEGSADADIAQLEAALGAARHRGGLPAPRPRVPRSALAAAFCIGLAAAVGWSLWDRAPAMRVTPLAGAPVVEGAPVIGAGRLREGETITTDAASAARLRVGDIGSVRIGPDSEVRLLETRRSGHRLAMDRGRIEALIIAPPRLFFVETPGAVAVDLGCAYTLEIDDAGVGLLEVTSGTVALEWQGASVEVPAGTRCAVRAGSGPGAPWKIDASETLVAELERIETGQADRASLPALLMVSRRADTITLWRLLEQAAEAERGAIVDRLLVLVPAPPGIARDDLVALEPGAAGRYRAALERYWY